MTSAGKAAKIIAAESTAQLEQNQRELRDLLSHQDNNGAIVAIDASYNNPPPPKGRYMSQPATQSSTPVVEYVTKKGCKHERF